MHNFQSVGLAKHNCYKKVAGTRTCCNFCWKKNWTLISKMRQKSMGESSPMDRPLFGETRKYLQPTKITSESWACSKSMRSFPIFSIFSSCISFWVYIYIFTYIKPIFNFLVVYIVEAFEFFVGTFIQVVAVFFATIYTPTWPSSPAIPLPRQDTLWRIPKQDCFGSQSLVI